MTTARTPERSARVREVVLASLLVAVAVVPFLASPRVPPGSERRHCVRVVDLPGPFHLNVNCDSPEFLFLARDPRLILSPAHQVRQARPLYPVIGWTLALPFRALGLAKLGALLPGGGVTRQGVAYGSYLPEYTAFVLLNWALLIATLMLLRRLLAAPSYVAPSVLLSVAVILVNEVTKAFFWTPHLQILNVFVCVATLSLLVWMQARGSAITWRGTALLGLVLGLGGLVYGSFAVPAGAAALCLVFGESGQDLRVRVRAITPRVAALLAAFALPIGAWMAIVVATRGSFYSHEVEVYRQFVWIGDSLAQGTDTFWTDLLRRFAAYTRSLAVVSAFPVFVLVALRLAAYVLRVSYAPSAYDAVVGRAIMWYLVTNVAFFGLLGNYYTRLVWTIVPPLVVLAGREVDHLHTALTGKARTTMTVAVAGLAVCYVLYWFVRPGPYS